MGGFTSFLGWSSSRDVKFSLLLIGVPLPGLHTLDHPKFVVGRKVIAITKKDFIHSDWGS